MQASISPNKNQQNSSVNYSIVSVSLDASLAQPFVDGIVSVLSGTAQPKMNVSVSTAPSVGQFISSCDVPQDLLLFFVVDNHETHILSELLRAQHSKRFGKIAVVSAVILSESLLTVMESCNIIFIATTDWSPESFISKLEALPVADTMPSAVDPSQNYKNHFDNGPIPMWIVNDDTMQFIEVNNIAVINYGYSRDEFRSMTLKDIRPNDDLENFENNFTSNHKEYFDAGYWKHRKKNGEIFYVHVYSYKSTLNNIPVRISTMVDVTEIYLTNKQNRELNLVIQAQKEELDNLLESITDGIWSRDATSLELIYGNDSYFSIMGYSRDLLMNNKNIFFDSIHPEDKNPFFDALRSAVLHGRCTKEYRYLHPSGKTKIFQARVSFEKGADGRPDTVNGITVDVTEARELQEKIIKSEQNLLATINNTKDLIWSVNENLEITFCNRPYQEFIYKLTGKIPRQGEFVLGDWGSETFIENRRKDYERALNGESFTTIAEEYFGGEILYKEFSNNPIFDHFGKVVGVNCIARDISEQKKQMLHIQEQNNKLMDIAWIQSHKVRGPVATILGLASLLNYNENTDEPNAEIIINLKLATQMLDDIIREIVEKTKILKD
jgi:PAS domain S-box-containing protein